MFEIRASKSVLKDLEQLPRNLKSRVKELLEKIKLYPVPADEDVKKLRGLKATYRIRIGKYRMIYRVFWENKYVKLLYVGTREQAYKILRKI